MAAQAELIAYGPMRKSAIALVGKHPAIDVEMKGFLPTTPENFGKAVKFDEVWWKDHGTELEARFKAWREQPLPAATDAKSATPNGQSKPADAKAATADEGSKPTDAKPATPDGQTGSGPNTAPKPAPTPSRRQ
jgi:putative spermidine/putrescine transport system substrate-binding protein